MRPFLTAVWSNLCLVTYAVPPELLEPRIPGGFQLDTIDGNAFVSLVAFDFLQTRVMGVMWPGFVNFPEINLRYYVRAPDGRRGVMFVRELVPSALVSWVARTLYNEPYAAAVMRSDVAVADDTLTVRHDWSWAGQPHALAVASDARATLPTEDSTEHFFKEHRWGFGVTRDGETLAYEVRHPHWRVHAVHSCDIQVDLGQLYGAEFGAIDPQAPYSVVHAEGSAIEVHRATRLRR